MNKIVEIKHGHDGGSAVSAVNTGLITRLEFIDHSHDPKKRNEIQVHFQDSVFTLFGTSCKGIYEELIRAMRRGDADS